MRSQKFAALASLGCFVAAAAIALIASNGARNAWWDYETGLKILSPAVVIALAGSVIGAVWAARSLRMNDSTGMRYGAIGLAGCLVVAFIPLNQLRLYLTSPPIHDITTDVEFPPQFVALLPLRAGAANGPEYDGLKLVEYGGRKTHVAAAQHKAYSDIRADGELEKPTKLFWHGFETAKRMSGWHIVSFSEKDGTIEAYTTSFWFGLTADISIRVKPAGKIGARLDIRSKSRTGQNDMGMNAAIVRDYMKALR
jgi:hypothetical protein